MRVLIVDDSRDSRDILKKTLEAEGYEVSTASNGIEAMRVAMESIPDIFISDILMPGMDGFRLCYEVKQNERLRDKPFVFYTATYVEPEDERLARSLGASRFIIKPVETERFVTMIKDVLKEHREKGLEVHKGPVEEERLSTMYMDRIIKKLDEKVMELQIYKKIFESAHDAICVIEPDGHYILQNPAHRRLTGYSDDELMDKTPALHVGQEVFSGILNTLSTKGYYRGELIAYDKAKKAIYILLSVFPLRDEKDNITHYVWVEQDISSRKHMENELKRRLEELEDFYKMAVDRELRMKELKQEIERLREEPDRRDEKRS
jgi:PAS domain S-box-containing protein